MVKLIVKGKREEIPLAILIFEKVINGENI